MFWKEACERAGNRVRITGQLDRRERPAAISGPTGSTARWRTFSTLQDRVTADVVNAIVPNC